MEKITPERWERVEQLYYAAVELESGQRPAFLDQACSGDEELLREVESLLAYENETAGFIRKPAMEVVARELADEPALSTRTIDHFQMRIRSSYRLEAFCALTTSDTTTLCRGVLRWLLHQTILLSDATTLRRGVSRSLAIGAALEE